MKEKILIIEDDEVIVRFIKIALETNGYDPIVANSGLNGISLFLSYRPDVVLLDLGLPDISGLEVLKQIKAASSTPVIVVSARGKESEKVEALDSGADDYVTKPFNIGELLARIRVALRKVIKGEEVKIFEYRGLTVNFEKRMVKLNDSEVHLTPIEYRMLVLLIQNQGKVLTHSFIQENIWGYQTNDDYQTLRVFMASIRRKIETDSANPKFIATEIGVGYRFLEE